MRPAVNKIRADRTSVALAEAKPAGGAHCGISGTNAASSLASAPPLRNCNKLKVNALSVVTMTTCLNVSANSSIYVVEIIYYYSF